MTKKQSAVFLEHCVYAYAVATDIEVTSGLY